MGKEGVAEKALGNQNQGQGIEWQSQVSDQEIFGLDGEEFEDDVGEGW